MSLAWTSSISRVRYSYYHPFPPTRVPRPRSFGSRVSNFLPQRVSQRACIRGPLQTYVSSLPLCFFFFFFLIHRLYSTVANHMVEFVCSYTRVHTRTRATLLCIAFTAWHAHALRPIHTSSHLQWGCTRQRVTSASAQLSANDGRSRSLDIRAPPTPPTYITCLVHVRMDMLATGGLPA